MPDAANRYYVTFGIGMMESFDAADDAECDRIVAKMINSRDSLATLDPSSEVVITDPMGLERKSTIGSFLDR